MSRTRIRSRRALATLLPSALLLGLLPTSPARAYWQLTPQLEAGITYENNPRYITDEEEAAQEAVNPDIADDAAGTYLDARIEGTYKSPRNQLSLTPRIRKTDYLKSNKDLNDDDWYISFASAHTESRGSVGLNVNYRETGVRTSEFESAIPDNPDDPPPNNGGSGRFSDDTQKSWDLLPSLSYQLSPRNAFSISGALTDTTYDQQTTGSVSASYMDYSDSSIELALRHYLNRKNSFVLALNGGNFLAELPGSVFENSTDSFGITAAYDYTFSDTLSGTVTVGVSRSAIDVSGITSGVDPLTGSICTVTTTCSISSEERNFVGNLSLRKRSELTTLNLSLGRAIAPSSNGTEVVQDTLRLFVDRTLTQKLTGTLGTVLQQQSAVGNVFQEDSGTFGLARQDRTYFSVDSRLSWQLTEMLSVYGSYAYISNEYDETSDNAKETNNRLFFGVLYRGIGLRR